MTVIFNGLLVALAGCIAVALYALGWLWIEIGKHSI